MNKYVNKLNFELPPADTPTGALAKLWRKYLTDNGFVGIMPMLIEEYLKKNKETDVKPVKLKNKSTMFNNVSAREMSIKTLFDLVFNVTNAKDMELSLKITLPNGKVSTSSIKVLAESMDRLENKEIIDVFNAVERVLSNRNSGEKHDNANGDAGDASGPT